MLYNVIRTLLTYELNPLTLGVNFIIRKMASNSKPLIEIEQSESNDFSIKINSTFVKKCTLFKVGQVKYF